MPKIHNPANVFTEYLAFIGSKGGASTSEDKRAASRLNGTKGGRPRAKLDECNSVDTPSSPLQQEKMSTHGSKRKTPIQS
jgi:hypothetical protein